MKKAGRRENKTCSHFAWAAAGAFFFPSCTEPRGAGGLAEHPGGLGRGRLRCAEGSSRESAPFPRQAGTALAPPQLSVFKTSLCWLLLTVCAAVDCKQPNPFAPANHLIFFFFFRETESRSTYEMRLFAVRNVEKTKPEQSQAPRATPNGSKTRGMASEPGALASWLILEPPKWTCTHTNTDVHIYMVSHSFKSF